ncbi:MAG: Rrf2 family transcriptional regulator [Selenomonadaceae bacterium]|nr:Rrf2 family transcriptional regulator [Selenomonadaceae bacterium]MBR1580653.1 Rrf2 family transcriptional regulator [Selenomonadaceae bacterium]
MKISAKGRYALISMTYLAQNFDGNRPITLINIAGKMGISKIYLEQVFAALKRANLVDSVKGAQGGYQLRRLPREITVYDILSVIELGLMEPSISESKVGEFDRALNSRIFEPLDQKIFDFLKSITLEDILTAVANEMDASSQMYFI